MQYPSPLRYPGGKASLSTVLRAIIHANELQGCTYIEPFAGGVGAGIRLLSEGHIGRIIINDYDRAIFCFWNSVMRRNNELVDRICSVPLTIEEWRHQREIYRFPKNRSHLDIGFSAFYLNRCNRSGIIKNAGPIGGIEQSGEWKIDARFNRSELARRIKELGEYKERIIVLREDATLLIKNLKKHTGRGKYFVYADPPYYVKGRKLYMSHFTDADHAEFAALMVKKRNLAWVMTYDDVPRTRELYDGMSIVPFSLRYSAHADSCKGGEILISPQHLVIPELAKTLLTSAGRNSSAPANASL